MPFKELPFNRIVVIDDEPVATFIAQTILQRANLAHQVQLFNNPEQALLFLYMHYGNASPLPDSTRDLILLDLNMPLMSGFDLLEALQSLGLQSLICQNIVVLSSEVV